MPAFINKRIAEINAVTVGTPSDCPYKTHVGGVIAPHEENHTGIWSVSSSIA